MNEYEVEEALRRFHSDETPNLAAGAQVLAVLVQWTNQNSDGWCYWVKPQRAAKPLMALLEAGKKRYRDAYYDEVADATTGELKKALTPVKAFLTRQGVTYEFTLPEGT